jgi:hypothetical protein
MVQKQVQTTLNEAHIRLYCFSQKWLTIQTIGTHIIMTYYFNVYLKKY